MAKKSVSLGEASALLDSALSGPTRRAPAKKKRKTAKRRTAKRTSAKRPKRKTTKRATSKRRTKRAAPRRAPKRKTTTKRRAPAKRRTAKRKTTTKRRTTKKKTRAVSAAEKEMLGLKSHPFDADEKKFLGDYMGFKKKHGRRPSLEEMGRYNASGAFLAKPKRRTNWAKIPPRDWGKVAAAGGLSRRSPVSARDCPRPAGQSRATLPRAGVPREGRATMVIGPRAKALVAASGYRITNDEGVAATARAPEGESEEDAEGFAAGLRAMGYRASALSFALDGRTVRQVTFWRPEATRGETPRPAGAYSPSGVGASFISAPPRGRRPETAVDEADEATAEEGWPVCRTCGQPLSLRTGADGSWHCACGAEVKA